MTFNHKTIEELHDLLVKKEISAVELTQATLADIKEREGAVDSFITVSEEEALAQAAALDAKGIDADNLMSGIPLAVKDNISTKGILTTAASKMLYNYKPIFDATSVEKLYGKDMIIVGKTNMDEFAMGGSGETSYYGATKNAWDHSKVPGGSSSGSAASVASGQVRLSLGSDTGGSIRQPAAFNGIVGLKPTYGTVSRFGLIAFGSSLDQIGPVAKDVTDVATILETIASHDEKDSTSVKRDDYNFTEALVDDVKGLKIGIPKDYFGDGLDKEVKDSILNAVEVLKSKGAIVEEFDLSLVEYAIPAYYVIASAEASSNLERFDGVKYGYRTQEYEGLHNMYKKTRSEGFGEEVKRRIMLGSFVLSSGYYDAYYKKGLQVRRLIKNSFADAFEKYDMILSPVAPTVAYKIGENSSDPLKMYLGDIYTVSVNLAGLPGVTVPCGFGANGMPVGMQLIGDTFTEDKLVKVAYAFQKETDFHTKKGGRA